MTPGFDDDIITPTLRPIIFLHGINGHADEFDGIIALLRDKYRSEAAAPIMHSIGICEGSCSLLTPLPKQRDAMIDYLVKNAATLGIDRDDGFNIVAHSQGALLMRAVIQKLPHPGLNVRTYVSMAGPQRGQWGPCLKSYSGLGPTIEEKMARPMGWIAFYNPIAQHGLSVANYWNDPRHSDLFRREANFLPGINGYIGDDDESTRSMMAEQKDNFLRIGKAVFLGSSDDDCINPPLSSVFRFVDDDGNPTRLKDSLEYEQDTFGLKTMDDEGRLVIKAYSGYDHTEWLRVPHKDSA
eukprot:CAMPEP_0181098254 /NCGR_PEP_ID=MMETSP1071-20121207/12024_1 /TAXON_ID=35127 /ORGANISM="Thalassiosira sp., Strain NH16" /LENGTH=296 /DNA_ID=CAMNT_0023180829 /DNA_START=107 /DNA_END=994 /DNA_ORIENTATION=+